MGRGQRYNLISFKMEWNFLRGDSCPLWCAGLTLSILGQMPTKYPNMKNHSLFFLKIRWKSNSMKKHLILFTMDHASVFPWDDHYTCLSRSTFFVFHILSRRKRCVTQKSRLNKINNICCFIRNNLKWALRCYQ